MRSWYDRPGRPWQPLVLTNPSLDLAVAWGAAYFAWLRHTGGRRIGGGIARSYYIGVASGEGRGASQARRYDRQARARPSPLPPSSASCRSTWRKGRTIDLEKPELELALGQPVTFPLYTSTVRADDKAGDVLTVAPDQLLQMPPLHTILRGGKRAGTKHVPVTLAARSTAIGTLELFCVAKEGSNRWRLEFNIRDLVKPPPAKESADGEPGASATGDAGVTDVWPEAAGAGGGPPDPRGLRRARGRRRRRS